MDLHRIAIRAFFIYLVLLSLIRLSGKRTVSEGTPFSFVLALILGDTIEDGLWAEVPMAQFVTAAGTLATVHLLVSWAASRSDWIDRLVSGRPALVFADGRPCRAGLRGEQMSDKQLAFEIRQEGVDAERWPEVSAVYVETRGAISLLLAPWARAAQRRDKDAVHRRRERG
jgi:uncharacterized membrane protein YcaP (DUF421 family)